MAGFTPVTSMVRNELPDYIGVDQLRRRNALAEIESQIQQQNAEQFRRSNDLNAQRQQMQISAMTAEQEAARRAHHVEVGKRIIGFLDANEGKPEFAQILEALNTDDESKQIAASLGVDVSRLADRAYRTAIAPRLGMDAPKPVIPFEQTDEAKAIRLRGQVDAEADARRYRREMELARLRQQPGPTALPNEATTATAPKLPIGALKLVDEANQAINTSQETLSLVADAKALVDNNAVNLGAGSNLLAEGKNALGFSDENSRAYASLQQTLEKLRNNYLLLAKGVQTEGDAARAWDSEIGKNAQRDNKLASQQLGKAKRLMKQAIERQQNRINRVYANYGATAPQTSGGGDYLNQTSPTLPSDVDAILKKYGSR